jgi:CxxC-x17-CxxC domain-containing protein
MRAATRAADRDDAMLNSGSRTDRVMICRECGRSFIFSAGGQEYYAQQGFREAPKRCRACRAKRKEEREQGAGGHAGPQRYSGTCWSCQKPVSVPFKPAPGRPVFCKICYAAQKRRGLI